MHVFSESLSMIYVDGSICVITAGLRVRHNWKRETILLTTILRISSGTFLLALQIAWAEE